MVIAILLLVGSKVARASRFLTGNALRRGAGARVASSPPSSGTPPASRSRRTSGAWICRCCSSSALGGGSVKVFGHGDAVFVHLQHSTPTCSRLDSAHRMRPMGPLHPLGVPCLSSHFRIRLLSARVCAALNWRPSFSSWPPGGAGGGGRKTGRGKSLPRRIDHALFAAPKRKARPSSG